MESLKRTPELKEKGKFELPDGTEIIIRQVKASVLLQNADNKKIGDLERSMHILAAKMLVKTPEMSEFKPIVYEYLKN
jgi:hypothetical protein